MRPTTLTVNGSTATVEIEPRTHLADFLREAQGLTGTHIGCEHGICGACTVEIDGEISRSCITYAVTCDGAQVRTIEGFDDDALMARLRAAFTAEHALQCGYCTPGMLIAARDLIKRHGALSERDTRVGLSGNLCRCTGYAGIVRAVQAVMADVTTGHFQIEPAAVSAKSSLGPAPGPGRTSAASAEPAMPRAQVATQAPAKFPQVSSQSSKIVIETGPVKRDGAITTLSQSFIISQPIERVWSVLSDLPAIIACMPGASLEGNLGADQSFRAQISLRLGPIRTTMAGDGTFACDQEARTCKVSGRGRDNSGPSSVDGHVDYRASPIDAASTRVEAALAYSLAGPLAQFGRPALVQGLVAHIGESLAQNLDAAASGRARPSLIDQDISVLALVWGLIKASWAKILGK